MAVPALTVTVISHLVPASTGNQSPVEHPCTVTGCLEFVFSHRFTYVEDNIFIAYWVNWRHFESVFMRLCEKFITYSLL